jgi:hypothetical protein
MAWRTGRDHRPIEYGREVTKMELTFNELDAEHAELLPARETLFLDWNWANVVASNTSVALNAGSYFAIAKSAALQKIVVVQH